MQIHNNIHYSRDPYLISKKEYDKEHKPEDVKRDDITSVRLEEKIHAKTVNAIQSSSMGKMDEANTPQAVEKAIASYNEIDSSQEQFNRVKEMV